MRVPERILNLEADGNEKYKELQEAAVQKKSVSKKGTRKPTKFPVASSSKTVAKILPSSSKTGKATKPLSGKSASARRNASSKNISKAGEPTTKAPTKTTGRGKASTVVKSGARAKPITTKVMEAQPSRKRKRSPDDSGDNPAKKRVLPGLDDSEFSFITGTYDISAPYIREQWDDLNPNFFLKVSLTSEKKLFAAFHLGIASGVLQSTVNINRRVSDANANFEWCGQQEGGELEIYPPEDGMKGVLRFSSPFQDGHTTLKGVIEEFPAVGKLEFTAEKVKEDKIIEEKWDDYSLERAHETSYSTWGGLGLSHPFKG